MGVMLPYKKFIVSSLLAVITVGFSFYSVNAQVPITDNSRFDVTFTLGETVKEKQSVALSIGDLKLLTGADTAVSIRDWNERNDHGFFVNDNSGMVAINGLRPGSQNDGIYAVLQFINESRSDFDAFEIAFDFLYKKEPDIRGELKLYYRVNQNAWNELAGTAVSMSSLQSSGTSWSSFSIQSHIDGIYLRHGDILEFAWIPDNLLTEESSHLPIALQQIELRPAVTRPEPPARGSIIITEILTSDPQSSLPEYIEVYNPTGDAVPLKGMVIATGSGEIVVQGQKYVDPYSFFVLATTGGAESIPFDYDYRYPIKLLAPGSAFVELRFGDTETAKATYNQAQAGVALELDQVSNAFDGYTSMQHFANSPFEIERGLHGTPGRRGTTSRMFSHAIQYPGWHIVSLPGIHNSRLNRNSDLDYRDLSGDEIVPSVDDLRKPILVYADEESLSKPLFVDENGSTSDQFMRSDFGQDVGFSLISLPGYNSIRLGSIANEMNLPVTPAVQVWDASEQAFRVKFGSDAELNPWSPIIINSEVQTPAHVLDESRISSAAELDRFIRIRLFEEETGRRDGLKDELVLGFSDSRMLRTDRRFDLPKLFPILHPEEVQNEITLLYAGNTLSRHRANSFTHLPHELDDTYQIGVGIATSKSVIQGVLDWSAMQDIPDEWVLTLEDRVTGNSIDMREHANYRFRYTSSAEIDREEIAENPLTPVTPHQNERFVITIKPYKSALDSFGDSVRPGSVELRQNFPNPFNPATNIVYYLPEETHVRIGIWNVVGQQVALLVDDTMRAGENSVSWNAADMPSGIYIVQLETGNRIFTRKITLIK